jgi:hypothetical protein
LPQGAGVARNKRRFPSSPGKREFACDKCEQKFLRRFDLMRHSYDHMSAEERALAEEKRYRCSAEKCDKVSNSEIKRLPYHCNKNPITRRYRVLVSRGR